MVVTWEGQSEYLGEERCKNSVEQQQRGEFTAAMARTRSRQDVYRKPLVINMSPALRHVWTYTCGQDLHRK